jgi:UTP-glucose-1-phosphate uridylyltransferase
MEEERMGYDAVPSMKLTQAILPIAGLGTRFLPWTKVVPKELLPIGNVPIIARIVDEALSVGITDICFVISPGKEAIPAYFFEHPGLEAELQKRGKLGALEQLKQYDEVNFHVVYQHEQHGDGHAILQARDWIESDVIAVLFGDDLLAGEQNALQQLYAAYDSLIHGRSNLALDTDPHAAMLCLEKVPREALHRYGVVEVAGEDARNPRLKRIKGLVEKPQPKEAPSSLGIIGKYLIPLSVIDALPKVHRGKDNETRLIDALVHELSHTPIYGYECEGKRYDTGTPEGYREAAKDLT